MNRSVILIVAMTMVSACEADRPANRVVGEIFSDRIELTAEFAEPITEIAVREGEQVTAGQVLIRQDATRAIARFAESDAAFQQASARLDELLRGPRDEKIRAAKANLDGALQELEFRRTEETRISELHQRGLASAEQLDRAVAALDAADANSKLRKAQLEELLAGTTAEELAQAEQALEQVRARRDAALLDVERHTLRAPTVGVADSRLFEIGERPGQGQPVVVMLGGEQAHARVYVPEKLRVHVSIGTPALLYVDGLTDALQGEVRWIASEAAFTPYYALTEHDRGRLSYVAKIDITEARDRLPDGVPVEVELQLD